ncbi:MAG: FkbM family methyltransferase, partial [Gammaproteobacteria bacterium]
QDVAIDCGANVGLFTVPMAETGAEVHAFEPNPDAFQELERVTMGYANVTLHQAAVTAESGPVDLYLHKHAGDDPVYWSKSSSLLADKSNVREDQSVRVEGIQLSRFIQDLGRPVKLLKMDIEGAEVDVLNQLLDEGLHESIEHAFVEVHDRRVKRLAEPTQRLRDRLQELGASHFRLDWR